MARDINQIISEALQGNVVSSGFKFPKGIEKPWKFIKSNGSLWTVYLVRGEYHSRSIDQAIASLKHNKKFVPCFYVPDPENIEFIASRYAKLRIPVVTEIAGRGCIVPPPKTMRRTRVRKGFVSLIPPNVIQASISAPNMRQDLKALLGDLFIKYNRLQKNWTSEKEYAILDKFSIDFMQQSGLRIPNNLAQNILHDLESSGMGGRRDHYFHSFQNFFYGLWAVVEASDYFKKCMRISKLNWNVSIEFVWFLVCLWHDVGYSIHYFEKRVSGEFSDVYGANFEESDIGLTQKYLDSPEIKEGIVQISSLIEHLFKKRPQNVWSPPTFKSSKSPTETAVESAFIKDFQNRHAAAGSLRLFSDMRKHFDSFQNQDQRSKLMQTTWLACSAIPFHDWHFRKCVREYHGDCKIPALTMPFAVLLAYIDSIQEDRRNLSQNAVENPFLHKLLLSAGRIIESEVNIWALADNDIIWKMIESNDVYSAVGTNKNSLEIKYPKWMVYY